MVLTAVDTDSQHPQYPYYGDLSSRSVSCTYLQLRIVNEPSQSMYLQMNCPDSENSYPPMQNVQNAQIVVLILTKPSEVSQRWLRILVLAARNRSHMQTARSWCIQLFLLQLLCTWLQHGQNP